MEPDNDILGGPGGGPDELRSIVARAGRHRRRWVAGISTGTAVVALAAGAGIGYALSNNTASTEFMAFPPPALRPTGRG